MAKAKLAAMTAKWIAGKAASQTGGKVERQITVEGKTKQTVYISREAARLLWHNRAETGETISRAVEKLVMQHLRKVGRGGLEAKSEAQAARVA